MVLLPDHGCYTPLTGTRRRELAWAKDGALMGPIIVAGMALAAVSGAVRVALTWLRRRDRLRHAGERARRERLRQSVRGQVAVFGWRGIAVDIGPGGRW
jgi:hypothetical protein